MRDKIPKVLVADDDPDIVEILSYNLEKENFEIFKAYNGRQAIATAIINNPDFIIMDIRMPEMSGIEACRMMKTIESLKDIPVMILTADSDERTGLKASDAGCNHYIIKSVKPAFIVRLVKDSIQHNDESKQS